MAKKIITKKEDIRLASERILAACCREGIDAQEVIHPDGRRLIYLEPDTSDGCIFIGPWTDEQLIEFADGEPVEVIYGDRVRTWDDVCDIIDTLETING